MTLPHDPTCRALLTALATGVVEAARNPPFLSHWGVYNFPNTSELSFPHLMPWLKLVMGDLQWAWISRDDPVIFLEFEGGKLYQLDTRYGTQRVWAPDAPRPPSRILEQTRLWEPTSSKWIEARAAWEQGNWGTLFDLLRGQVREVQAPPPWQPCGEIPLGEVRECKLVVDDSIPRSRPLLAWGAPHPWQW
jgi:hypothetical protein